MPFNTARTESVSIASALIRHRVAEAAGEFTRVAGFPEKESLQLCAAELCQQPPLIVSFYAFGGGPQEPQPPVLVGIPHGCYDVGGFESCLWDIYVNFDGLTETLEFFNYFQSMGAPMPVWAVPYPWGQETYGQVFSISAVACNTVGCSAESAPLVIW